MKLAAALTFTLLSSACVSLDTVRSAVADRAASELGCDASRLAIVHIEGDTDIAGFEVEGCGRRRSYAGRCRVQQIDINCHVVAASGLSFANAAMPPVPAPPAPATPP